MKEGIQLRVTMHRLAMAKFLLDRPFNLPVSHEDEGGDTVEGDHAQVGNGQVHQEVVCYAPHAPVSCNFK